MQNDYTQAKRTHSVQYCALDLSKKHLIFLHIGKYRNKTWNVCILIPLMATKFAVRYL